MGVHAPGELADLYRAARTGRAIRIIDRTSTAIDEAIALCRDGKQLIRAVGRSLRDKPSESAPNLGCSGSPPVQVGSTVMAACRTSICCSEPPDLVGMACYLGSRHRTGGLALALIDLAVVFDRLPVYRDPLLDALAGGAPLADGLTTGALAGAAYHLFVDAGYSPAHCMGCR